MVKKTKVPYAIYAFAELLFIFFIMYESIAYKYLRFTFNISAIFFTACAVAIFAAVNIIFYLVIKRLPLLIKIIPIISVFLVTLWVVFVFWFVFIVGCFWESETSDFDTFEGSDEQLNTLLDIAGLNVDDITNMDIQSVDNFYYYYHSYPTYSAFKFKGNFNLTEEDYYTLKTAFLDAPEFEKIAETDTSGCFEINSEAPKYESKTTVDTWNNCIIKYSDTDCSFYFDFDGII